MKNEEWSYAKNDFLNTFVSVLMLYAYTNVLQSKSMFWTSTVHF